jgi:hypothetical protein
MPLGLGGVTLCFVRKPALAMDLESTVSLGLVPVPVQDQIADIVRTLMDDWVSQQLVAPNSMHFRPGPTGKPPAFSRSRSNSSSVASRHAGTAPEEGPPVDDEVERAVLAALTHRLMDAE